MIPETASERPSQRLLNPRALASDLPRKHSSYETAKPFPHIVLDDFLVPEVAEAAIDEFPTVDPGKWINYLHVNERKYGNTDPSTWGPTLRAVAAELTSPTFVRLLEELTGIEGLLVDDTMEGGGLHQSLAGGYLNVHADFTVHPQRRSWRRRVNLLLYLNRDWPAGYGGALEFWSTDMKRCEATIPPLANRVVIFNTDADSFHGHPEPLQCPPGVARQSMALYYFTLEHKPTVRSTEYRARPGEGARSLLIYADKQALRAYDGLKRRLRFSDAGASRLLRWAERFRLRRKR